MKKHVIKQKAETILAEKLCRCIKKVENSLKKKESKQKESRKTQKSQKRLNNIGKEARAIAICKNSIFTKKNVFSPKFTCKGTARLLPSKHKHNTLTKRHV